MIVKYALINKYQYTNQHVNAKLKHKCIHIISIYHLKQNFENIHYMF